MPLKKRGLGRGLEALLAGVWVKDASEDGRRGVVSGEAPDVPVAFQAIQERSSLSADVAMPTDQADAAMALIQNIHRERRSLLEEAEALEKLIDEFDLIVRADFLRK